MVYTKGIVSKCLLTALLVLSSTIASSQLMAPSEAKAEVENICQEGCVVLSKAELDTLNKVINDKLEETAQYAYRKGIEEGLEAAKQNPKICLRNI